MHITTHSNHNLTRVESTCSNFLARYRFPFTACNGSGNRPQAQLTIISLSSTHLARLSEDWPTSLTDDGVTYSRRERREGREGREGRERREGREGRERRDRRERREGRERRDRRERREGREGRERREGREGRERRDRRERREGRERRDRRERREGRERRERRDRREGRSDHEVSSKGLAVECSEVVVYIPQCLSG